MKGEAVYYRTAAMDKPNSDNNFPFPYAIININEEIIGTNEVFDIEFAAHDAEKKKLKITNLIPDFNFNIKEQKAIIRAKCYRVFTTPVSPKPDSLFNVFMIENGCQSLESAGCDINKTLVSLIFIDNYEDVMDTVEEVRQPLLLAVIDRKINKMAQELGGVVKKFEKDKYIFLFSQDKLEHLKEKRFEILDEIREIELGNSIPVTLSVGIGINGNNLAVCMEYARAAIDLALSRGGDQALIKDRDKYYFYGGRSRGVDVNSRVRARVKAYALTELIQESENVIIMGHKNSDLDCLGSGLGIFAIVNSMQKSCKILLNSITPAIDQLYDRVCQSDGFINIFVKNDEVMKLINDRTLLIVVDTHNPRLCEFSELTRAVNKVVVFDHHRKGAQFIDNAVLTYHEPYASSTSELVTEMLQYISQPVKLNEVEVDALLAGITVDTRDFTVKTGIKTFEAAAFLKRNGADTIRVQGFLKNTLSDFIDIANTVANAEIFAGNISLSICKTACKTPLLIAAKAADQLLGITGIEASFVLCPINDFIYVSARSLEKINVQRIMEKLGGGGHLSAAAAQLKNMDMETAIAAIKRAAEEYLEEEKQCR